MIPERLTAGGVVLVLHGPEAAPEVTDVINRSLDHLRPWMAWAHRKTDEREQAVRLAIAVERARAGEDGIWSILDEAGAVAGGCGLHVRSEPDERDIGYWIAPWAEGRGYVTRAAAALTTVAFDAIDAVRVRITCDEANVRSARVPERLGFAHAATLVEERDAPADTNRTMVWLMERARWAESPGSRIAVSYA